MKKIVILILWLITLSIGSCKAQLATKVVTSPDIRILKEKTNELTDTSYSSFTVPGYSNFALDINISGGVTVDAFATLDESLSNTDTTGWVPYNTQLFGSLDRSDNHILPYTTNGTFVPSKVLLRYICSDNTNYIKTILGRW